MALGLAVMAGWLLDLDLLERIVPQLATMKFNTVLGFLLVGGALLFRGTRRSGSGWRKTRELPAPSIAISNPGARL